MEIKGIIHAHSEYSYDAKLTLSELRALCIQEGLQFACMTEHTDELTSERAAAFVLECDALSDEVFRFIPGFEVPYRRAHILMIGSRVFEGTYAPTIDALRVWTKKSPFVVLAHPVRNNFEVADDLLVEIDALEVWNQQYEGKRVPRIRSLALLRTLRAKKPELVATAGVDLHRKEHMGSPCITLAVDHFSEKEIIEKLAQGAFVASSPYASLYGTLPDINEKIRVYRMQSHLSVFVIMLGKMVNKILATFGVSLPKSLKVLIRKKI